MSLEKLKDVLINAQYVSKRTLNVVIEQLKRDTLYVEVLRKEFEKLPYVKSRLYSSTFINTENCYKPTTFNDEKIVADMHFLNGAWYGYQERNKE